MSYLKDLEDLKQQIESQPDDPDDEICPLCDGYGHIIEEDTVRVCSCVQQRRLRRKMTRANIPRRYLSCTLANFKTNLDDRRLAVRQVQRFLDSFDLASEKPGMFLYGAPGTGKTHLAISALRELVLKGYEGLFYNTVSLIDDLRRAAANSLSEEGLSRLTRAYQVDVLVLDDLGAGKLSDFVLEKTYSVIDQRYTANLSLIVTSNLPMRPLEEQISYPVFSRIRGMCTTIHTGEEDYRNPDLFAPNR